MKQFYITALNADDILRDVDLGSSNRAGSCTAQISNIDTSSGSIYTVCRCSNSRNVWEQLVQLFDFNYIIPEEEREFIEPNWDKLKADYPELLNSALKVECNCPAFQYWGSHYILHQLDTALTPEDRFPEIRDPNLEHVACKHLVSVFRTFFR